MKSLAIVCCLMAATVGFVGSLDPLEFITTSLFSNCNLGRSWLGLDYQQLKNTSKEPNVSLVNLYLYTQTSTTSRSLVGAANALLQDPNFDKNLPVTIFCHGWLQNPSAAVTVTIINTLKAKGVPNVLYLDSFALIGSLYLYASSTLPFIGEALGTELNILAQNGIARQNIHIIGFSMGAHIAGFAGKKFKVLNGGLLGWLTGLDPAGLCFYDNDYAMRLNSGDAAFVDIIHTNTGVWGTVSPHGHVDFYPNDGDYQPGCLEPLCSHDRAWKIYNETILYPKALPAFMCGSWLLYLWGFCNFNSKAYMGYAVDKSTRGVYYLTTKPFYP